MVSPRPPAPVFSEFYQRKRRLALVFAALSIALMVAYLVLGSFFFTVYRNPRIAWDGESIHAFIGSYSAGEGEEGTRHMVLDESLRLRAPARRLIGSTGAFLVEGGELTAFFGMQATVLRGGNTVRSSRLDQAWEVRSAVYDPWRKAAWIFGWREGQLVARRRELKLWSEAIPVAPASDVERVTSGVFADTGPLVAWRERGSGIVRTARFDGTAFQAGADFELGATQIWDATAWGDRTILVSYHREDRSFKEVTFRVRCCEGCGKPPLPGRVAFRDAVLLVGKQVSGIAVAAAADRLVIGVARSMTAQAASVPLPALLPEPGRDRLFPVGSEPAWRTLAGALWPILMLFFSFSLVFLGFTLLRERSGFILERLSPVARDGPVPAEILQRAMAYILDLIVLLPPFWVAVEVLNVSPETTDLDLSDPKLIGMAGVWVGLDFLYHFAMEWGLGWTLGKRIIGIRVAELDGARLTLRGALVRNLLRVVDAEYPLGVFLGASVMMATARRQRLGDLAARTMVVRESGRRSESGLKPGSSPL